MVRDPTERSADQDDDGSCVHVVAQLARLDRPADPGHGYVAQPLVQGGEPGIFIGPASFPYRAYHASEVQYLFDVPNQTGAPPLDAAQQQLADTMKRYWTQFARAGDPNGGGPPSWPRYTVANDTFQSLAPPTPAPVTGFAADHKCAFWDAQ